jgi:HK97 family phage major capsid protein
MEFKTLDTKLNNLSEVITDFSNKSSMKIQNIENKMNNLHLLASRPEGLNHDYNNSENLKDYISKDYIKDLETKSLSSSSGDGGELVLPNLSNNIIARLCESSIMRRIANVQNISSNAFEVIIQNGKFTGGWVKEQGGRDETETAKFERKTIYAHELYAQPKASQRLLDDAEVDIQKWLVEQIISTFTELEDASFINGEGENCPKGILKYEANKITQIKSEEPKEVGISDLLNLINSLDEKYLSNAHFLMHRSTLASLQNLQDNNGRFIWQPALSQTKLDSLFGIPVLCCGHMPLLEENNLAIALGDFKSAYTIVDKKHIALMRDPYTEKPFVKFYVTKRVGGDVVNINAIKLLKV